MKANTLKRMTRRALIAIACSAALAAPMFAQQDPSSNPPQQQGAGGYGNHGPENPDRRVARLTKALNLSSDQASQIKSILTDGQQQMQALRQDTSVQGPDRHARMMALRQAEETKIKGVLTDDQKAKFDAMQAQGRERREERKENGQNPPPPAA
jgi:Spy/CpxP family protein refolding chaperone